MKRLGRWLFNLAAVVSAAIFVGVGALWVRTEWMRRYETLNWSRPGVYRSLEFSSDDLDFWVLRDPGIGYVPLARHTTNGGWVTPPAPSNPASLPKQSNTIVLPRPRQGLNETRSLWLPQLGFDYAEYDGWYGPGTAVYAYRISYFVALIPASVVRVCWIGRWSLTRYRHRHRVGFCPVCRRYDSIGRKSATSTGKPSRRCERSRRSATSAASGAPARRTDSNIDQVAASVDIHYLTASAICTRSRFPRRVEWDEHGLGMITVADRVGNLIPVR